MHTTGRLDSDLEASRAVLLARLGRGGEVQHHIDEAVRLGSGVSHFHHAAYSIACAYALMGKTDLAMDWLQRTANDGMPAYLLFAGDPALASLHSSPRYAAFMRAERARWERLKKLYELPESELAL